MRKSANKKFIETTPWNTKDLVEGSTLEGKYVSSETFIGNYGETTKYIVEASDGTNYGIYSTASIDRQFKNIPEGSYVWITFRGLEKSKNGREVKVFDIDFDDEL